MQSYERSHLPKKSYIVKKQKQKTKELLHESFCHIQPHRLTDGQTFIIIHIHIFMRVKKCNNTEVQIIYMCVSHKICIAYCSGLSNIPPLLRH